MRIDIKKKKGSKRIVKIFLAPPCSATFRSMDFRRDSSSSGSVSPRFPLILLFLMEMRRHKEERGGRCTSILRQKRKRDRRKRDMEERG